jgi:NAD(P)-dependent dehydrogenase (short-subunit alcohol dehydrogenase family)
VTEPRSLDYAGKGVLVTGGVRGIGRGITEAFLAAGAEVVVCARHDPNQLPSAGGRTASFVAADIRDPEAAAMVVDTAAARFAEQGIGLDVVVNNAGGSPLLDSATASPRVSTRIIELNLLSPLHISQRANAIMQQQDTGGSIIMISSVSGARPSPGTAVYGAAKAGLVHLAKTLAIEWSPKVRLNSLVVGLVATEQAEGHYGGPVGIAKIAQTIPARRMGTPEDVAGACLFLGSPLASFVSGAALDVHGGGDSPQFLTVVAEVNNGATDPLTGIPTTPPPNGVS